MDGLNLDPGLRQAYTKQTQQRFLTEANNARLLKSVKTQESSPRELKRYTFGGKLRAIGQIIRDTSADIVSVIRAGDSTANA